MSDFIVVTTIGRRDSEAQIKKKSEKYLYIYIHKDFKVGAWWKKVKLYHRLFLYFPYRLSVYFADFNNTLTIYCSVK